MKIASAQIARYDLPLKRDWASAAGRTQRRVGFLLTVEDDEGRVAYGDAAPMPGTRLPEVDRCGRDLESLARRHEGGDVQDLPEAESPHPAARHAGVQAMMTLRALERKVPLSTIIAGEQGRAEVRVNAVIPIGRAEATVDAATRFVADGFPCIKVKIGPSPRDLDLVGDVRLAIGPDVDLRVDANGSWAPETAVRFLKEIEPHRVEYVEQPLPPGSPRELVDLALHTPVPIAADESAQHLAQALSLIERRAVHVVIVKPMALGGLDHAWRVVQAAEAKGVGVVVTDSVESAIGRAAALHLASVLPTPRVCGLASGMWLDDDLVQGGLKIQRGRMRVSREPGLGVEPTKEARA